MTQRFADLVFTPGVRAEQLRHGSRAAYARWETGAPGEEHLGEQEQAFIGAADSFYLASVGETGWPYVQHRGGPRGFLRVIDEQTIGFADFRGNRQYVSVGNLRHDARVALIIVDYASRTRLKLLGHASIVKGKEAEAVRAVTDAGYRGIVERAVQIRIAAFDWNCPQHITPRFTQPEVDAIIAPLKARISELENQLLSRR